jgi:hypothetical protein
MSILFVRRGQRVVTAAVGGTTDLVARVIDQGLTTWAARVEEQRVSIRQRLHDGFTGMMAAGWLSTIMLVQATWRGCTSSASRTGGTTEC